MSEKIIKARTIEYSRHDQSRHYGLLPIKSSLPREIEPHRHDFFEFEVVIEGEVSHSFYGRKETLVAGDFHCLSPDTVHRLAKLTPTALVYNVSVMPSSATPEIAAVVERLSFPSVGHLDSESLSLFVAFFDVLFFDSHNAVPHEREKASAIALYLLTLLSEHAAPLSGASHRQSAEGHLHKALRYVQEGHTRDIRLGEVAAAVGVSAGYLSILFSTCLGTTYKEYLTATRLRHAVNLLLGTDHSVTEIAYLCGFGCFSSFARAFSKTFSISPREYRRRGRRKDEVRED